MKISEVEFIRSPGFYLDKVNAETVFITKDGRTIAALTKPSSTPISDSLLGILKEIDIKNADDIKAMRTGM